MRRASALLLLGGLVLGGVIWTGQIALTRGRQSARLNGYWTGAMTMNGKAVDIAVTFDRAAGSLSSKDLMVLDAPISRLAEEDGKVSFAWVTDDTLRFEGRARQNRIEGTVDIPGLPPSLPVAFSLTRQSDASPARAYLVEPLTVESAGARLAAQIYVPRTPAPHPALVMLHGSSGSTKDLLSYDADFFAALGFEVLIFDRRGAGASTGNDRTATYDDLANDAAACLEVMSRRKSIDPARIGLWGYSQGAMLLPLVLTKTAIPAFLIAKSPEVDGETEAAAYSDGLRIARARAPEASGQIVTASHRKVREMIRAGSDRRAVEAFIRQNARRYPFMNQTGLSGDITIDKDEFDGLYWKGRMQDFRPLWERVRIPTLALFGEDDEYIDPAKNMSLLAGFKDVPVTTRLFPRATHNLKKAFNPSKYPDIDWPRRVDECDGVVARWVARHVGETKRAMSALRPAAASAAFGGRPSDEP